MGLDMKWWVKNKLHISSNPVNTIDIEGYKILKYKLTKDDLKIQSEEELNYLLYYR